MTDNHENFFQEIEEDVRLEKLQKLWNQYKNHIVGGIVAILLSVSGGIYWNNWRLEQRAELGEKYAQALSLLEKGQDDQGLKLLDDLKGEKGYGPMAMLTKAGHLAKKQETLPQAIEIYNELYQSKAFDKKYSQLAGLLQAFNQLDTGNIEEIRTHLDKFDNPDNPWQALIVEMKAALELRAGNKDKAEKLFSELAKDARASQALQVRAMASIENFK